MKLTNDEVNSLARRRHCPRCDFDKTLGSALCRRCRSKLPAHMRIGLEKISTKDGNVVGRALRAAVNYLNVHFQSVRNFGGGKKK